MKVPAVIAPSEQQDPLRIPYSNVQAGPGAFGAAIAQGVQNVNQTVQEVALAKKREDIKLDVSEQVYAGQDVSNKAVARASSVTGPDAAAESFPDEYDKEIAKGWEEAAKAAKTPHARKIIEEKGRQDRLMSVDAIRRHSAQQRVAYQKVSNELVVTKATEAASLAPDNDDRQTTSENDIAAMVNANMEGATDDEKKTAVKAATSAMYLAVAQSIPTADPTAASEYYEKHKDKISPGEEKAKFESALATKQKDFNGEMLARQAVADPKNKTMEDIDAWLQEKTKGDKNTVRFDEAKQRATGYFNDKLHTDKLKQDAFEESSFIRLHRSGYNIDIFSVGDISSMGSAAYGRMRQAAKEYHAEVAAAALTKGEMTPARARHVQAWAAFQTSAENSPGYLVGGKSFTDDWMTRLGPEYVDEGLKLWNQIKSDIENPGSRTVDTLHGASIVQDQLRRSFPNEFPAEDSVAQWKPKPATTYLNVKHHLDQRIAMEQRNKPGHVPTPSELQAWTVDAIKTVKTRADGTMRPAYELTPEQVRDPNFVVPEEEQRFRDFFIPFFQGSSSKRRTPEEFEVRGAYIDWIANGKPPLPAPKVDKNDYQIGSGPGH